MKIAALILGAGRGNRVGGAVAKQYQLIGRKAVFWRTLQAFVNHQKIFLIQPVIGYGHEDLFMHVCPENNKIRPPIIGGNNRQQSAYLGLESLKSYNPDYVLIHDAARPFVSQNLIDNILEALSENEAAIPALAMTDTLKQVENSYVKESLNRRTIWAAQTPQGFNFKKICQAHHSAQNQNFTDDSAIAEAYGIKIAIIAGETTNHKLTSAEDIRMADQQLSQSRNDIRIGQGIDIHPFALGGPIMICGVEIAHTHHLQGHSDADVGLHALTDALLGAIGENDIGTHFPPSDPQWKGAASHIFLKKAAALIADKDGIINNIDISLLIEKPRIAPHINAMKKFLTTHLHLEPSRIAIKATTTEKLGFIGRQEGVAAFALATIRLPN